MRIFRSIAYSLRDKFRGSDTFYTLAKLREAENLSEKELAIKQEESLLRLIEHSYNTTKYYHDLFEEYGVVVNGRIDLSKFSSIPPLTKEVLRNNLENLISSFAYSKKTYWNSSGGSTGEPVKFLQDSFTLNGLELQSGGLTNGQVKSLVIGKYYFGDQKEIFLREI